MSQSQNSTNIHLPTSFLKSMLPIITNEQSKKCVMLRNFHVKKMFSIIFGKINDDRNVSNHNKFMIRCEKFVKFLTFGYHFIYQKHELRF